MAEKTTKTAETTVAKTNERKKVRIKIPIDRNDNSPFYVCVNNDSFLIKRGEYVEVPDYIAAEIERSEKQKDENYQKENQAVSV